MKVEHQGTIVAVFDSQLQAQTAINDLRTLGFTESQLGVAAKSEDLPGARAMETSNSDTADGATAGAALGLGAGTLWGLGILAGVIPAIGPVIAGGSLAALAASAATGAAAGGVGGALISMGVSNDDVNYYDAEFSRGHVIVTVDADDRAEDAQRVLSFHGGRSRPTTD